MNFIDRGVLVLRPKQPFVDWVNSFQEGDDDVVLTLDEVANDPTAYLTPEFEGDEDSWEFLEDNHSMLFEHELIDWRQDENDWPSNRDFAKFMEWFEAQFHSMVLDLLEGEIEAEADFPTDE